MTSDGTGVAGAVVFLRAPVAAPAPGPPPRSAVMDQIDKQFVPHVLPIAAGTEVRFPNRDQIHHHVYSFSRVKSFDLPLSKGEEAPPVLFDTRTKIFVAFSALIVGVLLLTLGLVEFQVRRQTERTLTRELMVTGEVFRQLLGEREDRLLSNSVLLTGDFALKRAISTYDPATLATVAVNYRERSGVDLLWILDESGHVLADASGREPAGSNAADRPPIAEARATDKPAAAIAAVGDALAQGVTAPVATLVTGMREVLQGNLGHRVAVGRRDEIGFLATSFNEMTGGLEERARIRDVMDKVVSPEVTHELLARGLALGGELREVTVLFADLRDSTALGEQLTPSALLNLLNAFLSRMGRAIERERGIVDKYVGDEIMAVFGAPLDLPDHAERAVTAALAMIAELGQFNVERALAAPLRMGVGIATGTVIAGNVGSSERLNYTALGDVVNLAARLEALTKEHGEPLLMNETTHAAVQVRFAGRCLGTVTVRGRAAPTMLYTVGGATVAQSA